jgi:hypothetical protein
VLLAAVKFKTMLEKLKQELEKCKRLWSKYSCDCLHFEMLSLEKRIAELMATEYDIIQFDGIPDDEYVDIKELEKFIENAEIVLSSYGMAWSKSFINKVGNSLRGATLEFNDGLMTYGYNVKGKLVRKVK